ncbi:formylglycine-generating enzyme family protein [Sphingomonas sp.]|jgi:formylglycine-generating enzyme required for sulfatase activity|uniref:formylglycine-generating enzyme family protein n=1 Tax=Sphingomonas sp. TaxID=28214 RepID=UPI002D7E1E4E|nr:SUMF1/EgtB/PvdO family nonheme iron enzyme [Sphingomonas sp.]HEU0043432.1 SUMF1/EgtB/PvdO family nonheme iron enzyme [Sphingomonas sp.]
MPTLLLALVATLPGHSFRDRPETPVMVVVPAGRVLMGSDEAETTREGRPPAAAATERPRREVRFERPFAVARAHVTMAEFEAFASATRRPMAGCLVAVAGKWGDGPLPAHSYRNPGFRQRRDEPAVCIDWSDASAYAAWLSARTGFRYRLLTEAEWEYAARAGATTARWWGDTPAAMCTHANGGDRAYAAVMPGDKTANLSCSDGFAYTSRWRAFPPNPFGLHDMLGNAWQWVADCFTPVPGALKSAGACKARSIRGGSWHNGPPVLRAATRFSLPPTMRSSSLGFRVMREVD